MMASTTCLRASQARHRASFQVYVNNVRLHPPVQGGSAFQLSVAGPIQEPNLSQPTCFWIGASKLSGQFTMLEALGHQLMP